MSFYNQASSEARIKRMKKNETIDVNGDSSNSSMPIVEKNTQRVY